VHIQRLAPEAIRIWIGDHISSTATVAIATDGGLVIIDTTGNPKVDGALRQIIARELGRSDFKILINTHEHGDHTAATASTPTARSSVTSWWGPAWPPRPGTGSG